MALVVTSYQRVVLERALPSRAPSPRWPSWPAARRQPVSDLLQHERRFGELV
jgi:hypothetical protein